jgi:hypothetical protein
MAINAFSFLEDSLKYELFKRYEENLCKYH